MAPKKFVAPTRKDGAGSSFSFSSNSSLGSQINQAPNKNVLQPASETKASTASSFVVPKEKPRTNPKSPNISVAKNEGKRSVKSTNEEKSAEPPVKRQILEIPASSEIKTDKVVVEKKNDNKENVKPSTSSKTKAEKDKPKLTVKSLTDKEYEKIFKAVLSKCTSEEKLDSPEKIIQEDDVTETSEIPETTINAREESQDLFDDLSEDDFDSEDETLNGTIKSKKDLKKNTSKEMKPLSTHSSCPPEVKTESQSIVCKEKTGGSSITAQQISEESPSFKTKITSEEVTNFTTTECDTPQKMDARNVLSLSQEQNILENISRTTHQAEKTKSDTTFSQSNQRLGTSAATPVLSSKLPSDSLAVVCSTSKSTSVLHEAPLTPLCTPVKTSAVVRTPQSSQDPRTPVQKQTFVHCSQSSQDLKTPVRTPANGHNSQLQQDANSPLVTPGSVHTPGTSRDPKTPIRTPTSVCNSQFQIDSKSPFVASVSVRTHGTPKTPNSKDVSHSITSTPSGSQQFSQEIQFTPPPSNLTARDRLKWIHKKRLMGLWVQCDKKDCGKWRYLADCHDPTTLPKKWFCSMNSDEENNQCSAPEKRESLQMEEDMIFNKYSPGSLVWARMPGYPWWPAMVDDDPDLEIFFWLNLFSDIPNWYHVVFFDEGQRSSCVRAWIPVERLMKLEDLDEENIESVAYKDRVTEAYKKACTAKELSIEDRLARFSFAACYKGPIGGPSSTKYEGSIGLRKSIT